MRKKKKVSSNIWCYYCDTVFEDEKTLVQHQKDRHFKCYLCLKKLSTAAGMAIHVLHVHKLIVDKVPNAKPGRESTEIEINGMQGIPPDVLAAHNGVEDEGTSSRMAKLEIASQSGIVPGPGIGHHLRSTVGVMQSNSSQALPGCPAGWPGPPSPAVILPPSAQSVSVQQHLSPVHAVRPTASSPALPDIQSSSPGMPASTPSTPLCQPLFPDVGNNNMLPQSLAFSAHVFSATIPFSSPQELKSNNTSVQSSNHTPNFQDADTPLKRVKLEFPSQSGIVPGPGIGLCPWSTVGILQSIGIQSSSLISPPGMAASTPSAPLSQPLFPGVGNNNKLPQSLAFSAPMLSATTLFKSPEELKSHKTSVAMTFQDENTPLKKVKLEIPSESGTVPGPGIGDCSQSTVGIMQSNSNLAPLVRPASWPGPLSPAVSVPPSAQAVRPSVSSSALPGIQSSSPGMPASTPFAPLSQPVFPNIGDNNMLPPSLAFSAPVLSATTPFSSPEELNINKGGIPVNPCSNASSPDIRGPSIEPSPEFAKIDPVTQLEINWVSLFWNDEAMSMEERRFALPKYQVHDEI